MHKATLSVVLIAAIAFALSACGSDLETEFFPQIDVTLAGQGKTSHEFFPDTTGGQTSQSANILIRNSGKGELKLTDIAWKTQNPFLSLGYPSGGKPAFPKTLKENETLLLEVNFKPDPNIEDNRGGRLEISHNDKESSKGNPIVLNFTIREAGCKIDLDLKSYKFINPSKFSPPEACFSFGNVGNAPCTFEDAYMGTATPYYTVTKTPNKGSVIEALGSNENPKNKPKKLEVCVRVKPESADADYSSSLIIQTSDKSNPKASIALNVEFQKGNTFKYTSDHPTGDLVYDFSGVTGGTKSRCLNVYNEGPSGYLVKSVEVIAYDDKEQNAAKDQYVPELFKLNTVTGDKEPVQTEFSVNAGKSLDICIKFTWPADNTQPVKARVRVNYTQAKIPDKVEFPIIAGKCDTPTAVFAPSNTPLWLMAPVGKSAKRTLLIANQSCAPLTIINGCVTQTTAAGIQDICSKDNIASLHFKFAGGLGLKTVDPWTILPVEVEFAPPNEKQKTPQHLININYCAGPFASNKCEGGGVVTRTLNIVGLVYDAVKKPTLKLNIEEAEQVVGTAVKIDAAATAGDFPIAQYGAYLWTLRSRPKGSKAWLNGDMQVTEEPWVTIKPDVAGEYEVVAAVQSVDPQAQSNSAWSDQVSIKFKAVKK